MSSLSTLAELPDVSIYDDWDEVKQAIQNWSVRDKFTFRTPCKDDKRARYVCTQKGCNFRVTGNKNKTGRITVKVVNRDHSCGHRNAGIVPLEAARGSDAAHQIQDPTSNGEPGADDHLNSKDSAHRNPATQMKWLVAAMKRVLDVTTETKPIDIQTAAKEFYNEEISYQQAFRCLRHLTADIKEHGHRDRVPDELRKAIVTLRVFVDPPMDWIEIERKTGIKARTAAYIFTSAEKKSGGSKDPLTLLRNATISQSGPKRSEGTESNHGVLGRPTQPTTQLQTSSIVQIHTQQPSREFPSEQSGPRKRRRKEDMIDPNLDVAVELARAATSIDHDDHDNHNAPPRKEDVDKGRDIVASNQ